MHVGLLDYKDEVIIKMMRERFLIDLISNKENNIKSLKEKMSGLDLNPYITFPAIALIEPTGSFAEVHTKRHHIEQLRDFLEQNVSNGNVVFMNDDGRIGLLFSWVSRGLIEKIHQMVSAHFPFEVNIGIGKPCSQLCDVHRSYHQAALSLQDKFYKGNGKTIYYSEFRKYHNPCDYPFTKEKELFDCLKSSDASQEIERSVDAFYEFILQNGPVEIKEVYEITFRLLVGLEKRVIAELEKESEYNKYEIMSIVNMETLQEIKDYLYKYLAGLREVISQKDKESHRSIIKKSLQYMEQECQHATLHSVAQNVYMTPTYLSLLFKLNTGKTFIEQLTDIRIDKAKLMLKNTHLKNYEIAEKVGYQDSRYFSQIFKKKVGLPPSEYRDSIGK